MIYCPLADVFACCQPALTSKLNDVRNTMLGFQKLETTEPPISPNTFATATGTAGGTTGDGEGPSLAGKLNRGHCVT